MRSVLALLLVGCCAQLLPAQNPRDDYEFAAGLHDRGLHERAVGAFTRFLAQWPDDERQGKAWFFLGASRVALGDESGAREAFESSMRTAHPLQAEARLRAGECAHRLGAQDDALRLLKPLATGAGLEATVREAAQYFSGEAELAKGDTEQAARWFEALAKTMPDSSYLPYAWSSLGHHHLAAGDAAAARGAFLRCGSVPEDLEEERRRGLAQALLELNQVREAAQQLGGARDGETMATRALRAEVLVAAGDHEAGAAQFALLRREGSGSGALHASLLRAAARCQRNGAARVGLELLGMIEGAEVAVAREAAYWKGLLLSGGEDAEAAVAALERALGDSEDPARRYRLGDALLRAERPAEALQQFRRVIANTHDAALAGEARYASALALHRLSRSEEAVSELEALLSQGVDGDLAEDARMALGENLFALGRHADAVQHFQVLAEVTKRPELQRHAWYKAGWCWHLDGRHDAALPVFEALAKSGPDDLLRAESRYLVAKSLEGLERPEEARRAFEAVARAGGPMRAKARLGAARAARASGDLAGAAALYAAAANDAESPEAALQAAFAAAEASFDLGRIGEAQERYQALTRTAGSEAGRAWLGLAWCARQSGDHEAALAAAEQAGKDATRKADALHMAGASLLALERYEEAANRFMAFLAQHRGHPRTAEVTLFLATAFGRDGKAEEARGLFESLAESEHADLDRESLLYEWAFATPEGPQREARFAAQLEAFPKGRLAADAHYRLGEARYAAKDFSAAQAHYEAAAASPKLHGLARYKAAFALKGQEQPAKAAAVFVAAAEALAESDMDLAGESLFLAADQSEVAGDHAMARKLFEHFLATFPRHALAATATWRPAHDAVLQEAPPLLPRLEDPGVRVRVASALGDALRGRKQWERALAAYATVLSESEGPLAARAQYLSGVIEAARGRPEEALEAWLRVGILHGHPEWVRPSLLAAGRQLAESGQKVKARRLLEELVRDHANTEEARAAQALLETL